MTTANPPPPGWTLMDVAGQNSFDWVAPSGAPANGLYWVTGAQDAGLIRLRGLAGQRRLTLTMAPPPPFERGLVLDLADVEHLEHIDYDTGTGRVCSLRLPLLRSAGIIVGFWADFHAPVLEEAHLIRVTQAPLARLSLPALRRVARLEVVDCPQLESIELGGLHATERVTVRGCPKLRTISMTAPMSGPRLQLQNLPALRSVEGPQLDVERAYAVATPCLDGPSSVLLAAAGPPVGARFAVVIISGSGRTWSDDNADGFERSYVLEYSSSDVLEQHVARLLASARAGTDVVVRQVDQPMEDIQVLG